MHVAPKKKEIQMRFRRDPGAFRPHREFSRSQDRELRLPPTTVGDVAGAFLDRLRVEAEKSARKAKQAALEARLADLYRQAAEAAINGIILSGVDYNKKIEEVRIQIRQLGH